MIFCVIVILIGSISVVFINRKTRNEINYSAVLIEKLNLQQQIVVKDIFDFEFDRAYVFKDCYLSGEGFSKAYNLNISINQVPAGSQEYIGRIVFVDDLGNFIFEYQYDKNELIAITEGVIIYPNTTIKKCDCAKNGAYAFDFISSDYY